MYASNYAYCLRTHAHVIYFNRWHPIGCLLSDCNFCFSNAIITVELHYITHPISSDISSRITHKHTHTHKRDREIQRHAWTLDMVATTDRHTHLYRSVTRSLGPALPFDATLYYASFYSHCNDKRISDCDFIDVMPITIAW